MGPKQSLSFFFPQAHFYLKSEKYLTFLKRYFFWQKKVVIFAKSAQCDKGKVYGLNQKFFTATSLGAKTVVAKTHLLLKSSSTSKNSSTFWKLI